MVPFSRTSRVFHCPPASDYRSWYGFVKLSRVNFQVSESWYETNQQNTPLRRRGRPAVTASPREVPCLAWNTYHGNSGVLPPGSFEYDLRGCGHSAGWVIFTVSPLPLLQCRLHCQDFLKVYYQRQAAKKQGDLWRILQIFKSRAGSKRAVN